MARAILCVIVVVVGVGVGCPGGSPIGSLFNQGIPAGLYTGDVECTETTQTFPSEETETGVANPIDLFVRSIGPTGELLTVDGIPVQPGAFKTFDLGFLFGDSEVEIIITSDTTIVQTERVTMSIVAEEDSVTMLGFKNETLKLQDDGSMAVESTMSLAGESVDGVLVIFERRCSGTLRP